MISPGAIFKLMQGAMGPEQIAELFGAMGMDVSFQPLTEGQRAMVFQELARKAIETGCSVISIRGRAKDGDELTAILVASPQKKVLDGKQQKELCSGGRALEAPGVPQSL